MALVPDGARDRIEVRASSATEVGLLLHGLEFARVRHGAAAQSFAREDEVSFGAGANETPLTEENEALCRELCARLFSSRYPDGSHNDPLFRMHPEHWLESRLRAGLAELLPGLRGDLLYTQVPAISRGDRGLLDLLTLDRNGRLVVIELKANEDLHLPLQALDYWIRVRALNDDRQAGAGGSRPFQRLSGRDILRGPKFLSSRRACCWPRLRCAFILPTRPCCAIFRRRWSGSYCRERTLAARAERGISQAEQRRPIGLAGSSWFWLELVEAGGSDAKQECLHEACFCRVPGEFRSKVSVRIMPMKATGRR